MRCAAVFVTSRCLVHVGRPGLQHHHLDVRIGAEPVGHHRSGRAGSDDDVISDIVCLHEPESVMAAPSAPQLTRDPVPLRVPATPRTPPT